MTARSGFQDLGGQTTYSFGDMLSAELSESCSCHRLIWLNGFRCDGCLSRKSGGGWNRSTPKSREPVYTGGRQRTEMNVRMRSAVLILSDWLGTIYAYLHIFLALTLDNMRIAVTVYWCNCSFILVERAYPSMFCWFCIWVYIHNLMSSILSLPKAEMWGRSA